MASSSTSGVYIQVIEDVISKVREEFISNGGPGEGVLNELQGIWELKMMQAGAIMGPINRFSAANLTSPGAPTSSVRDLNVPYEGPEEYETPTADLLFPPTPIQTPLPAQTPLPGTVETSYNILSGGTSITPNEYPPVNEKESLGRPSQFMLPPSPWLNQMPRLDVNIAYEEGREEVGRGAAHQPMTQDFLRLASGKRKREDFNSQYRPSAYIPQQDGAGDVIADKFKIGQRSDSQPGIVIPQVDGPAPDAFDDALSTPNIYNYQGAVNEDYNVANTPAPPELQAPTPAPVNHNDVLGDDEDEPLNENDDEDDDVDDVDEDEELNTQHLILTQFDKVTRAKNRWRCILKDGIMHIKSRDILFNKASGEFDF